MDSNKKNNKKLKTKLDGVIEKSEAQKKLLKKILTHLNKQNEDLENQSNKNSK